MADHQTRAPVCSFGQFTRSPTLRIYSQTYDRRIDLRNHRTRRACSAARFEFAQWQIFQLRTDSQQLSGETNALSEPLMQRALRRHILKKARDPLCRTKSAPRNATVFPVGGSPIKSPLNVPRPIHCTATRFGPISPMLSISKTRSGKA